MWGLVCGFMLREKLIREVFLEDIGDDVAIVRSGSDVRMYDTRYGGNNRERKENSRVDKSQLSSMTRHS